MRFMRDRARGGRLIQGPRHLVLVVDLLIFYDFPRPRSLRPKSGPAGRIDPGERAQQGAIREVQEDLCVTPAGLRGAAVEYRGKHPVRADLGGR
jgi:hypothetical protein